MRLSDAEGVEHVIDIRAVEIVTISIPDRTIVIYHGGRTIKAYIPWDTIKPMLKSLGMKEDI